VADEAMRLLRKKVKKLSGCKAKGLDVIYPDFFNHTTKALYQLTSHLLAIAENSFSGKKNDDDAQKTNEILQQIKKLLNDYESEDGGALSEEINDCALRLASILKQSDRGANVISAFNENVKGLAEKLKKWSGHDASEFGVNLLVYVQRSDRKFQ
jgi:hypothetical protein